MKRQVLSSIIAMRQCVCGDGLSKGTKGRNRRGFSRGGRWAMGKVTGRGWEKTEKPAFSAIVVEPVVCI